MKPITQCRACGSSRLVQFLDLGKQYLSDFRKDDSKTKRYPLSVVFCESCALVQLRHTTPQKEMYHDRYGFKSGMSDSVKKDLDDAVTHAFQYVPDPKRWLDIACNDGTLLSFVPTDIYRVGVDPVTFLTKEAAQHADRIINGFFTATPFLSYGEQPTDYEQFDVITSISCFYDMPDPAAFVRDVKSVLAPHGVWLIQQNYLLTTMELSAVDNICHEHLEYYTLLALENLLERFGLEVNEVLLSSVNGGSIRTIVSHKGMYEVDESVERQRTKELDYGVDTITPYRHYADTVGLQLDKLYQLVTRLKSEGKSIAILAASTRGATIWQAANIDWTLVDYAIERNPAKVGFNYTAIGVPIIAEEEARLLHPDYMVVGPWFFADDIIKREADYLNSGGHFIIPLPEVKII